MDKPDGHPDSMRAIADAIVGHQPRKPASDKTDLNAMEAALVAEIEAFDLQAVSQCATDKAVPAQATSREIDPNPFPTIIPEGVVRTAPAAASQAAAQAGGSAPSAGGSLLEKLRQQAQARQTDDSARHREETARAQQLDEALRRIFSYCHELVQQLNILHPPVERAYSLPGNNAFSKLAWREGFTDYRTRAGSAGGLYELVTLSYQIANPSQLRIERDGPSADIFRRALFEHGIVFSSDEIKNARQMVEKVAFTIASEVKINLRWCGDVDRGAIILESRNLERFGKLNYVVNPQAVTPAMLDEFTRLLLGQANRFRDHCATVTA